MTPSETSWQKVDDYARERVRRVGDLYGWSRSEKEGRPAAVLLISQHAVLTDFPKWINDIEVELKPIPPPKEHSR